MPINQLKPDENQPRRAVDKERVRKLAVSIKNEGVINAIEVDEKNVIITGEMRWRAAKEAGLREVPVKVVKGLSEKERFVRQMQENIHQNTMTAWDTAVALKKILDWHLPNVELASCAKGHAFLERLSGINRKTAGGYLSLLVETGEVKKALQTPGFSWTKVRDIRSTPKIFREALLKKILENPQIKRDVVPKISKGLKDSLKYNEPQKGWKLLEENFNGLSTLEAIKKIEKIILPEEDREEFPMKRMNKVKKMTASLSSFLDDYPLESYDIITREMVALDLRFMVANIVEYLKRSKSLSAPKEKNHDDHEPRKHTSTEE